jgi:hypothetical protein
VQVGSALKKCNAPDICRILNLASTGTITAAGLSNPPGSAGDYMLAFGSSGNEPVIIGKQPVFEKQSRVRFTSGQSIKFELDKNVNTLKVYVDGNLEVTARNIDEGDLVPYVCIKEKGSATITFVNSLVLKPSSAINSVPSEVRSVAFDNKHWTYHMDTLLLRHGKHPG